MVPHRRYAAGGEFCRGKGHVEVRIGSLKTVEKQWSSISEYKAVLLARCILPVNQYFIHPQRGIDVCSNLEKTHKK